jgi:hypothetical protein
MVHRCPLHATVIDLASQTITSIDMQKKTYSVMTFDEMKQMMRQMSEKMNQNKNQGEMKFSVSAQDTGKTKRIAGLEATLFRGLRREKGALRAARGLAFSGRR